MLQNLTFKAVARGPAPTTSKNQHWYIQEDN